MRRLVNIKMIVPLLIFACSNEARERGSAKIAGKGDDQVKAQGEYPDLEKAPEIDPSAVTGGKSSLLDANYSVIVKSAFDLEVCKGDLRLLFNVNFGTEENLKMLDFPDGLIKCGETGTIDPKDMLGATKGGSNTKIKVKDGIIFVDSLGRGTYKPERPMFPSFLSAPKELLMNLNRTEKITLYDSVEKKETSGEVSIKVLSFDKPYTVEGLGVTFPKTIHFEVTNTGFEGIKKMPNMIFNKMGYVFSLDPIALLHVHFEGTVKDAIKNRDLLKTTDEDFKNLRNTIGDMSEQDDLIGDLTRGTLEAIEVKIDLFLQSMEGVNLPAPKEKEDAP